MKIHLVKKLQITYCITTIEKEKEQHKLIFIDSDLNEIINTLTEDFSAHIQCRKNHERLDPLSR